MNILLLVLALILLIAVVGVGRVALSLITSIVKAKSVDILNNN